MDKGAVKPDFFTNFSSLKRDEELSKKGITDEERSYYSMSLTKGWKLFIRDIENLENDLEQLNDAGVANGMPYEELGRNAVVTSLVKGILKRMVAKIQDAKEACESGGT